MHGLNDALDRLRAHVPCGARSSHLHLHDDEHQHHHLHHQQQQQQKLSKIETLRLARNYIAALADILATGRRPDHVTFARALTGGLSQNTVNLLAAWMHVNPRQLVVVAAAAAHDRSATAPPYHWTPFWTPQPPTDDVFRHQSFPAHRGGRDYVCQFQPPPPPPSPSSSLGGRPNCGRDATPFATGSPPPVSDDLYHRCCCSSGPTTMMTSLPVPRRRLDFRSELADCELNDSGYDDGGGGGGGGGGLATLSDFELDTDDSCESTMPPPGTTFFFHAPPTAFY